jgi:hypothetical protein
LTLRWALTADGEGDIARRWTRFLNALRIWAARRAINLAYLWVHENPPRDEPTFNTHCLLNVPASYRLEFHAMAERHFRAAGSAVHVQPRTCPGYVGPDRLAYMLKGCDKVSAWKFHLIDPVKGWDYAQGRVTCKRAGTSNNIGATARARYFAERFAG